MPRKIIYPDWKNCTPGAGLSILRAGRAFRGRLVGSRGKFAGFFDGGFEVVEDFPYGFYLVVAGEAEEVGRVVGGDGGDAVFCVEPAAAIFGDAGVGAEEVFEGDDDFGVDVAEFFVEPVEAADAAFFDGGGAVAFGAAFYDVGGMLVICRRVQTQLVNSLSEYTMTLLISSSRSIL